MTEKNYFNNLMNAYVEAKKLNFMEQGRIYYEELKNKDIQFLINTINNLTIENQSLKAKIAAMKLNKKTIEKK